ncbi:MAG: hypothetical protein LBE32_01195 [Burkholderiales bacterium]|nr:hypothetical protein [Burkholderiales bacterium]
MAACFDVFLTLTHWVRALRTRQHNAWRTMLRCSSLRDMSPLRRRALPGTPCAALASTSNCGFWDNFTFAALP